MINQKPKSLAEISHLIHTDKLINMPIIKRKSTKIKKQGNFLNFNMGNVKPYLSKSKEK